MSVNTLGEAVLYASDKTGNKVYIESAAKRFLDSLNSYDKTIVDTVGQQDKSKQAV